MKYPSAPRSDLVESLHGRGVADPYRWLEDDEGPCAQAFVTQQDACYQAVRETWSSRGHWQRALARCTAPQSVAAPQIRGTRQFSLLHRR